MSGSWDMENALCKAFDTERFLTILYPISPEYSVFIFLQVFVLSNSQRPQSFATEVSHCLLFVAFLSESLLRRLWLPCSTHETITSTCCGRWILEAASCQPAKMSHLPISLVKLQSNCFPLFSRIALLLKILNFLKLSWNILTNLSPRDKIRLKALQTAFRLQKL